MKQNSLTRAIQDSTPINSNANTMDTILFDAIERQFNEVFGPSSKCTLGGFWDPEPVSISDQNIAFPIIERLRHDLDIHDKCFKHVLDIIASGCNNV